MLPSTYLEGFHDRESVQKILYHNLGETGLQISVLGIGGGGALGGFFGPFDEKAAADAVVHALKKGLNFIDTSPWYGQGDCKSERILGKVFNTVPRNTFFIATKVGRYKPEIENMFDFRADTVKRSVDDSLQRLGLDYVDLIQIHDLEFAESLDLILNETLPALDEVRKSGKARFIGITGYLIKMLLEVVEKSSVKIDTVLSYCRFGVINNDYLQIIPQLRKRGIGIINASPIGMGLLNANGPPDWHPAPDSLKHACRDAVKYAEGLNVDLKKVALKLCFRCEDISTTLVGMERIELVEANLETLRDPLTVEEEQVFEDVVKKYFDPLERTDWEGIEVGKYREKLEKLKLGYH